MNSNFLKSLLLPFFSLVLAFAAGALAHAWYTRLQSVPPPALHPFDEFVHDSVRDGRHLHRDVLTPERIAELNRRLEMLRPQMEVFRSRLQGIEADFHKKFLGMLTSEQQERLAALDLGYNDGELFPDRPVRSERSRVRSLPAEILRIIAFRPHSARLSQALGLSDRQRKQLRELLEERRSKFIALLDDTPPPSIELGRAFEPVTEKGSP